MAFLDSRGTTTITTKSHCCCCCYYCYYYYYTTITTFSFWFSVFPEIFAGLYESPGLPKITFGDCWHEFHRLDDLPVTKPTGSKGNEGIYIT